MRVVVPKGVLEIEEEERGEVRSGGECQRKRNLER